MKKIRLLSLAIALVLFVMCLASCEGAKEKIKVTADVKVIDDEGDTIIDTSVLLEDSEPNVLMAIVQACQDENIVVEHDGKDITKIGSIENTEDDEKLYFWDCTFDSKPIEGKAGNVILTADKNHTIVYRYDSVKKVVTDEDGNEVKE